MSLFQKPLAKAVLISIVFHGLLFIIFLNIKHPIYFKKEMQIFIQLERPVLEIVPVPVEDITKKQDIKPVQKKITELPEDESMHNNIKVITVDSLEKDTLEVLDVQKFFINDPLFLAKKNPQQEINKRDSTYQPTLYPPFLSALKDSLKFNSLSGSFDKTQREIDKRSLGHERPIPLTGVLEAASNYLAEKFKDKEEKPIRMTFIPSDQEIEILKIIWEKTTVTDQEIYTQLDSSIKLTAADVNNILKGLTAKGLLSSKIVSPRNEFTIGIPFSPQGIEMSAKNRRNRVYEYKSNIAPEEVVKYLHAVLYETEYKNGNSRGDSDSINISKSLQQKILKIIAKY